MAEKRETPRVVTGRKPVAFTRVRSAEGSSDSFKSRPSVVSRSTSDAAVKKLLGGR
ncbi:MAG: hypothetical protein AB7O74_06985 [Candidatus Nanopelagicales bacterium]